MVGLGVGGGLLNGRGRYESMTRQSTISYRVHAAAGREGGGSMTWPIGAAAGGHAQSVSRNHASATPWTGSGSCRQIQWLAHAAVTDRTAAAAAWVEGEPQAFLWSRPPVDRRAAARGGEGGRRRVRAKAGGGSAEGGEPDGEGSVTPGQAILWHRPKFQHW